MKKIIIAITVLLAAGIGGGLWWHAQQATPTRAITNSATPTLWVLSDPHFISPTIHDQGSAFKFIKRTAVGKDLDYQTQTITALVAKAKKAHPDALIITGDITLNGEKKSAEDLSQRLAPLTKAGIKLLIMPGNHDIYDGWARSFKGADQLRTDQISPNDWQTIWHSSYAQAASTDASSLSYRVNLNHDYQLICLDSNIYGVQQSSTQPNTGGELKPATMKWLKQQLIAGQKSNRRSLVFMHHNLYRHNQQVYQGFVLNNAPQLRTLLDDYNVPVLFSGHIHAQDISADPQKKHHVIEVVSGSFATSPNAYGVVKLSKHHFNYREQRLSLTATLTKKERQNPDLLHHQAYLKQLFIESGEGLAYRELPEGLSQAKADQAAQLLGNLNWRYFTGQNRPSQTELAAIKKAAGYQTLAAVPEIKAYLETILVDHNLPNDHLDLTY
ncbi:metallophosphoesterase [Lacticaseibacillus saniviri]|uniref:3, 5-cyclic-nucleotide phosphodiesterase n=2 Tax=Lacticaseibacillus saniviri TaxID=931533 RepID=A0A0R2MXA2_9LACO|nr:metallophosphoesterase [Lacticaseibacillus saniviri]KRO16795.1 3, 5-cyclic-nucleotide phosphodiesterase [Lacticaseibacillus saniviri JCM 17471 = DSM 24301]